MKRGPYQKREIMSLDEVAHRLGWSRNMTYRAWCSGIEKLKADPACFEALLLCVKGYQMRNPVQARSVECQKEWIERNSCDLS